MRTARVVTVIEYANGDIFATSKFYMCSDHIDCAERFLNWREVMLRENNEIIDITLESIEMLPSL